MNTPTIHDCIPTNDYDYFTTSPQSSIVDQSKTAAAACWHWEAYVRQYGTL